MSDWTKLSLDARLMCAGHFSFGTKTKLTFQTPWNVTDRAQKALNEALEAGVLTREIGSEGLYAHTYRVASELTGAPAWMMKNGHRGKGFRVMVSDAERKERPPSGWPVPAGFKRHPQ